MKTRSIIFLLFLFASNVYSQDFWLKVAELSGSVRDFAFNSSNHIYAGTLGGGVYRSTNNGVSWVQINNGLTDLSVRSVAVNSSGHIFAGTQSGGIFRSTNNGDGWVHLNLNNLTTVFSIGISNNGTVIAGSNGVYRSTDNGNSWARSLDSLSVFNVKCNVNGFTIVLTNRVYSIFRSPDNGITWQLREFSYNFNSLGVAPNGVYFATTGGNHDDPMGFYLHSSGDNGYQWGYLHNFGSAQQRVAVNNLGNVFVSRSNGIWLSTDNGMNGVYVNSGLNLSGGLLLALGESPNGYMYAGQENGFVYRSSEAITAINQTGNEIPDEFNLYQNYPNPFNPVTKIKFSLPLLSKGGELDLKLSIYDVLGREVAVLIPPLRGGQEGLNPGTYEVEFDGANYPSGVYFYKLKAEGYSETRRMVLIK
jgi:photosystem II stability/assembly factor-like uncharacterized protein